MDDYKERTIERLWVVFFRDTGGGSWWDRFTRPGFRHVSAAAWYGEAKTWVFYDPTMRMTAIVLPGDGAQADAWFGKWATEAGAILRVKSQQSRAFMPPFFGCVGAIKALLGVRSRALSPWGLFRDLVAHGAEQVPLPRDEHSGEPIWRAGHSAA